MNNTKHTTGPWKATLGLVQGPENQTLALIAQTTTSADANARLIAEAPAMLEALRDIREEIELPLDAYKGERWNTRRVTLRAILARIEGK